jgi:hypothetical protein
MDVQFMLTNSQEKRLPESTSSLAMFPGTGDVFLRGGVIADVFVAHAGPRIQLAKSWEGCLPFTLNVPTRMLSE